MKRTVYMHMPTGYDLNCIVDTINMAVKGYVQQSLFYNTPEESAVANKLPALVLITVTFETEEPNT